MQCQLLTSLLRSDDPNQYLLQLFTYLIVQKLSTFVPKLTAYTILKNSISNMAPCEDSLLLSLSYLGYIPLIQFP